MPIKHENLHRYPSNWHDIRAQVLARARYRCEWPGCGAPNHVMGYWDSERFVVDDGTGSSGHRHHVLRIVLTVAHLDHTPENCELSNLRAWCQRHHLRYDLDHHLMTAYMTRKANARTADLFSEAKP